MPTPRIHEMIDRELFNGLSYFIQVHSWIDGTFNGTNGRTHWANRHYIDAVLAHFNRIDYPDDEERERLILVSKFHILLDWVMYYNRIVLPLTKEDVIRELRSQGVFIE